MGMQTITQSISTHVVGFVQALRRHLCDGDFSARHRVRSEDFTRQRQLTFPVVMLFILQKTVKSIQRHLHEFLDELAGGGTQRCVLKGFLVMVLGAICSFCFPSGAVVLYEQIVIE